MWGIVDRPSRLAQERTLIAEHMDRLGKSVDGT